MVPPEKLTVEQTGGLIVALSGVANGDRLAILDVLRRAASAADVSLTITEIAARADLSRFSASRHLHILCSAGLVDVVRSGSAQLHRLRPEGFGVIEDWLYPITELDAGDPILAAGSGDTSAR